MTRRQFATTTLATIAAALMPPAFASTYHLVDPIVIDWKHPVTHHHMRHIELLRSDGLAVGQSFPRAHWAAGYEVFEREFLTWSWKSERPMSGTEFKRYCEEVKLGLDGTYA